MPITIEAVLNDPALDLNSFNHMKYGICDYEKHIDPDNNFYNDFLTPCVYYTNEQFNSEAKFKNNVFSIIHFNARSLKKNFENNYN